MKKIIICFAAGFLSFSCMAQKLNSAKVPVAAKKTFATAHPNTTGKWTKEKNDYEVSFKENGNSMSCVIDAKGNILETETAMPVSQLPAQVRSYMEAHYKHAKIKEAAKIVKQNGETIFEVEANGKDILFDMNGKFLKTVKA